MREREGKRGVVAGRVRLPKQGGHVRPAAVEKVATSSQKATHTARLGGNLVAAHRAIALLDPPANGAFASIICAIELLAVGTTPLAIASQATPQGRALQKQETEPIG
jgi:hypothetical protein